MKKILFLACAFFVTQTTWGQEIDWGVRAGAIFGGPIPTNVSPDSSDGTPGWGPSLAVWASYALTPKLKVRAELGYSYKAADYSLLIRTDTSVTLELLPGIVDTVPSFYFADVNGSLGLHYLELPIFIQYETFPRLHLNAGINLGYLLAGSDDGTADIQIGEGGIFEDTLTTFANFPDELQRFDLGVLLGSSYTFDFGLELEIRGYRSLTGLYRKGFFDSQGLPGNQNFNTQVFLGAGWRF